jgi:hypothetical protein
MVIDRVSQLEREFAAAPSTINNQQIINQQPFDNQKSIIKNASSAVRIAREGVECPDGEEASYA